MAGLGRHRLYGLALSLCLALGASLALAQSVQRDVTVSVGVGDTVMEVTGQTSPGAFVTIKEGSSIIGTTVADEAGQFSQTFNAQTPGMHNLTVYARDSQNRLTDSVNASINLEEHFTTSINLFLPPTISLSASSVTIGQDLSLAGEAFPNSTVVVTLDNQNTFNAASNGFGGWSLTLSTGSLSAGQHQLFAAVTAPGGSQSYPTQPRYFTVVSPPPSQAFSSRPPVPVITHPHDGDIIDGDEVTVEGTAQPGTQIEIRDGDQVIASVLAGADGRWRFVLKLTRPSYVLTARACNANACSAYSSPVRFSRRTPAGRLFTILLDRFRFSIGRGELIRLKISFLNGAPPYSASVDWGDGLVDKLKTDQEEALISHEYRQPGRFAGVVLATDAVGATAPAFFTTYVAGSEGKFDWLVLILGLLLLALTWWLRRKLKRRKQQT